jgi:hypothetical protein
MGTGAATERRSTCEYVGDASAGLMKERRDSERESRLRRTKSQDDQEETSQPPEKPQAERTTSWVDEAETCAPISLTSSAVGSALYGTGGKSTVWVSQMNEELMGSSGGWLGGVRCQKTTSQQL